RGQALVQPEHVLDVLDRLVQEVGDLLGRRLVVELLRKVARRALVDVDFLEHVHRQADGPGLVHDAALDGLADPPGGVGREAEAPLRVELLDRADQPEIAFLDQIEQRQAAVHVAPGDLHHQAQIALDHALARGGIALLRAGRVVHLLRRRQQRGKADLLEIQAGGIGLDVGIVAFGGRAFFGLGRLRADRDLLLLLGLLVGAGDHRFVVDAFDVPGRALRVGLTLALAAHLAGLAWTHGYFFGRWIRGSSGVPRRRISKYSFTRLVPVLP